MRATSSVRRSAVTQRSRTFWAASFSTTRWLLPKCGDLGCVGDADHLGAVAERFLSRIPNGSPQRPLQIRRPPCPKLECERLLRLRSLWRLRRSTAALSSGHPGLAPAWGDYRRCRSVAAGCGARPPCPTGNRRPGAPSPECPRPGSGGETRPQGTRIRLVPLPSFKCERLLRQRRLV